MKKINKIEQQKNFKLEKWGEGGGGGGECNSMPAIWNINKIC